VNIPTSGVTDDHKMYIRINDMNGKIFRLYVLPSDTIDMVKQKIQDLENIPKDLMQLSYLFKKLEDKHTLEHYNIRNSSTLLLYNALLSKW
jgi:hypothetical protein